MKYTHLPTGLVAQRHDNKYYIIIGREDIIPHSGLLIEKIFVENTTDWKRNRDDDIECPHCGFDNDNDGRTTCTQCKKPLEKLFTTEDGVDIYDREFYWWVNPKHDFYISEKHEAQKGCGKNENLLFFSSKEAAEKYIAENKPQYSIKEIEEAMRLNVLKDCPHKNELHINGSVTLQTLRILKSKS